MAQQQPRKQARNTGRQNGESMNEDMEMNEDASETQSSARGQQQPRQGGRAQGRQVQAQGQQGQQQGQDLLASITPALTEAREYIEGSPLRAAAIGAVAGGLLMTVFASEKGRQFVKMAYDYANPMVAKYAREYISQAAGDFAENAVSQH